MQPTREQIEELQRALLSAVDLDQLRMIVRFSFNKELDHFVPTAGRNLTKIVRSTLDWAGAQEGGFLGLAESALAEHPDNPELREFVSCYAGSTFDPLPEPKESDEKSSENLEHELHKPFRRNPTFVGRRHELRQLTSALKKDAFVALRGAPGIGKSTLALEVADHVAPDFERVFWYSFSSPCDAGNLVYQLASFLACYGRDALWRRLRTLGSDADSQVSRHFQMALTLLKQGGFVLFLEDLHNAQENELIQSMLAQLIARRFDLDIKLLITSRSKLDPKLPKRALLLGGLDQRDVQQYLKKQLKRIRLSSEHVQLLHAYTAGNPQFVALAAAAIEQGADPAQLISRLARRGEDIFAYLIKEVSGRLTLEQNLVMKAVAAHLGDAVTLEEINATAGEGANCVTALNSLLERDLLNYRKVTTSDGSDEDDDRYAQTNILRTFYYDELCSKEERIALHRRAAAYYVHTGRHPWLSALHSERGQMYNESALIAVEKLDELILQSSWHKADALLARLLVQELEGILPVRVRLAHARTTAAIEGWEAAVDDLQPAVELAAGDPYYAAFVRYRLAQAYFKLKEIKAAGDNFTEGIDLLAAAPMEPQVQRLLVRMHIGLAALRIQNQSGAVGAKASLDEAQRLLEILQNPAPGTTSRRRGGDLDDLRAQVASAWASYWQILGNLEQAIVHANTAWQTVRGMIPREPRFAAALNLATLLIMTQDPARVAQANDPLAEAEKTADKLGHSEWRAKCWLTRGTSYYYTGEMALAVSAYLDAYKIFVDLDDRDSLFDTCYNLADAYAKLAQCEEARRYHQIAATLAKGSEAAGLQQALADLAREYPKCLVPED